MKTTDLQAALNLTAPVAVSIYAPAHKMAPENQGDRIVVKNLVTIALEQIEKLGPKRDYESLINNLNEAFESVDWNHSTEGLGILASEQGFWKYNLSHSPAEQVTVSDTFSVAELAKTVTKSWEYYLLVLSESPTRLFHGDREMLTEIKGDFPMEHTGRGGASGIPTAFGQQTSVIVDEVHRQFFRKISDGLTKVQAENQLPLVATGVERFLAFWSEVGPEHTPAVGIEGSYDFMSEAELSNKVWAQVENHFRAQNKEIVENLNIARGNNTYAGGFDEVLEVAAAGRVRVLVVSDDETANPKTEQAIRFTMASGGDVYFVPAKELTDYASVAADMRF
jgi:hypothetical protein